MMNEELRFYSISHPITRLYDDVSLKDVVISRVKYKKCIDESLLNRLYRFKELLILRKKKIVCTDFFEYDIYFKLIKISPIIMNFFLNEILTKCQIHKSPGKYFATI